MGVGRVENWWDEAGDSHVWPLLGGEGPSPWGLKTMAAPARRELRITSLRVKRSGL